jgi:hypothetical protein
MRYFNDLLKEIDERFPELKKWAEEDEKYIIERKQFYLSSGCSEKEATENMWNDYWEKAKEEYGVEFSISKL